MIVQRLVRWLNKLRARLTLGRQSATHVSTPPESILSSHVAGHWLEDSHRLRPARPTQPAITPVRMERRTKTDIDRNQPVASRPRPSAPPPETLHPSHLGIEATPVEPKRRPETQEPVREQPAAYEEVNAVEGDAAMRRSLTSLRQLVKLGIYNEGFPKGGVPAQYHRGLEGDDSADSPDNL